MLCAMFGWNRPSGSGEDENLNMITYRQTTGNQGSSWAFSSSGLKGNETKIVTSIFIDYILISNTQSDTSIKTFIEIFNSTFNFMYLSVHVLVFLIIINNLFSLSLCI